MATEKKPTAPIEGGIAIPDLRVETLELHLIGDSPLIVHAWSEKAKRQMLDKQTKAAKPGREAKDPQLDFLQSLYKLTDGGYGFPSVGIKNAGVRACTSVEGVKMTEARQAFHIMGENLFINGAFPGLIMRMNMVRIEGAPPTMREDMVRVGNGVADLRYRGEYWPWFCKVVVRFNSTTLSRAQIMNLLNTAGFGVGIGEWRPERKGISGMFHVAGAGEVENLIKFIADEKQQAA